MVSNESQKVKNVDTRGFLYDQKWQEGFKRLQDYKEKHGHLRTSGEKKIAAWVDKQRITYKKETLESWKIERLNSLGFDWDPFTKQWQEGFKRLQDYKEKHGHLSIFGDPKISSWISKQRMAYKKRALDDWKIERLNSLGFDWDSKHGQWDEGFKRLQDYKEKHGHCRVPKSLSSLLYWTREQKIAYRKDQLESWKIAKLDGLQFNWDPKRGQWQEGFKRLQDYKEKHGHLRISGEPKIAAWVSKQRMAYKKGTLESWKIEPLNSLGFDWDPKHVQWQNSLKKGALDDCGARVNQWQERFKALKAYQEKHGHCNVPLNFSSRLSQWVICQRTAHRKGRLDNWKIERLNSLGFDWISRVHQWHEWFEALKAYQKKHGHCNVPFSVSSTLGTWVVYQRVAYRKGRLDVSQIEQLNALGFDWDLLAKQWQERFEALKAYQEKHGHCNVPFSASSTLRAWIVYQRVSYKKGWLDASQIEQLNALGFDWDLLAKQWQEGFKRLQDYKEKHEHLSISGEPKIAAWVSKQRMAYKKGTLDDWKIEQLNALGFDWNPKSINGHIPLWNKHFEDLENHKEIMGTST